MSRQQLVQLDSSLGLISVQYQWEGNIAVDGSDWVNDESGCTLDESTQEMLSLLSYAIGEGEEATPGKEYAMIEISSGSFTTWTWDGFEEEGDIVLRRLVAVVRSNVSTIDSTIQAIIRNTSPVEMKAMQAGDFSVAEWLVKHWSGDDFTPTQLESVAYMLLDYVQEAKLVVVNGEWQAKQEESHLCKALSCLVDEDIFEMLDSYCESNTNEPISRADCIGYFEDNLHDMTKEDAIESLIGIIEQLARVHSK